MQQHEAEAVRYSAVCTQRINLPGFRTLCRPEAMLQLSIGDSDYLVVMSEQSAAACVGTRFTIIIAEILAEE